MSSLTPFVPVIVSVSKSKFKSKFMMTFFAFWFQFWFNFLFNFLFKFLLKFLVNFLFTFKVNFVVGPFCLKAFVSQAWSVYKYIYNQLSLSHLLLISYFSSTPHILLSLSHFSLLSFIFLSLPFPYPSKYPIFQLLLDFCCGWFSNVSIFSSFSFAFDKYCTFNLFFLCH